MGTETKSANGMTSADRLAMPEPVARLLRYAGTTMRTARSPNLTAREAIAVGDWLAAVEIEISDLRQQLWNESRQHDMTRGDLNRTMLALDELVRRAA